MSTVKKIVTLLTGYNSRHSHAKNFFKKNILFLITLNSNTAKQCKYKKRYKELNFLKKKVTIYLHKNTRRVRLERKSTKKNKQTNKKKTTTATTATTKTKANRKNKTQQQQKNDTFSTQTIFPKDFSQLVYLLLSQKSVY